MSSGSQAIVTQPTVTAAGLQPGAGGPNVSPSFTFLDAAERVLRQSGGTTPLHYTDITQRAIGQGLLTTNGLTPDATMRGAVQREIEQATKQGRTTRFVRHGNGLIGLANWLPKGIDQHIQTHNDQVRESLHQKIQQMAPVDFEALIAELLGAMGLQNPVVTQRSNDGGVDVTATLVTGNVIAIVMAVQVKRWRHNVQTPTVTALRGSLGVHDHGLIVTTSDFSQGARKEAQRSNAVPVSLMNGDALVDLLVEHEIGVTRLRHDVLELEN